MATLKRLKSLYQPIESADVKTFLDSVNQEQKRIALEKSMDSQLIKNIATLAPQQITKISDFTGKISKKFKDRKNKISETTSVVEEFENNVNQLTAEESIKPVRTSKDDSKSYFSDRAMQEELRKSYEGRSDIMKMATDVAETFKNKIRRNLPGVQEGFDNPEERLANPLPGIQKQLLDIIGSEYKTIINKMSPQIQSKMLFDAKQRQKLMEQPEVVVRPEDNY